MKYYKLQDLCISITDCPHSTPEWREEGIRVVRNFNLKNGILDFTDGFYVDGNTYKARTKRAEPEAGDIIISREAPMGAAAIVPENLKCCLGQRLVLLKVDRRKCNPYYLLFTLMSDFVQTQFKRADATGSIVSNLCIPDLQKIIIPVIDEGQEQAAGLLRCINEKLALNSRINETLSRMASDIYMHTFFGKEPSGVLGDILVERKKSAVQVSEAKGSDGKYPFFTSGETILSWAESLTDGRNCFLNTGGSADVKFYDGKAAYSTDTWCITARDAMSDYLYLFLKCIKPELEQKFFQGTGLKHLQKPLLRTRSIYIPSNGEINSFNRQVQPILSLISNNTRENQRLTSLREFLLPMLMNGQAKIFPDERQRTIFCISNIAGQT